VKKRLLAIALAALAAPSLSWAAPSITSVTGTVVGISTSTMGNKIVITGAGYGAKSPAAPLVWAPFENNFSSPTAIGRLTVWGAMELAESTTTAAGGKVYSGNGALAGVYGWQAAKFGVRTDLPSYGIYGGKWFVSLKRYVNYPFTAGNHKWLRFWDTNGESSSGNQYPNIYVGTQGTDQNSKVLGEEFNPDAAVITGLGGYYPHPAQDLGFWRDEHHILIQNSAVGLWDGAYKVHYATANASLNISSDTFRTDTANAPGQQDQVWVQDDPSNYTPLGWGYFDDIYVDTTLARVYITTSSTLAGNSIEQMQIPSAWAAGEVTAYVNVGPLSAGSTAYLYVCDSADSCNANGYLLAIGNTYGAGQEAASVTATATKNIGRVKRKKVQR